MKLPRFMWVIKPQTKVKGSGKKYDRTKVKEDTRKEINKED